MDALYKVPKAPPEEGGGGFGASTTPPDEESLLFDTLGQETFHAKVGKSEEVEEILHRIDDVISTLVGRLKRLRDVITTDSLSKNKDTEAPLPVK